MTPEDSIKLAFPNLKKKKNSLTVTSPITGQYNCIAWAAGDDTRWWWPHPSKYWPPEAPREATLAAFRQAFEVLGYQPCTTPTHEPGFEKVAIYVNADNVPTHASRQLPDGRWTSKLGDKWDISHVDLPDLAGRHYGTVAMLLKRVK